MKSSKYKLYIALVILSVSLSSSCKHKSEDKHISISGAFALYPLTVKWAEEYEKLHPEVKIDISAGGAGKGMTDVLSGMVDLAMFSRTVSPQEYANGAWEIAVAKDAVVPVVNSTNPYVETIQKKGITPAQFHAIYISGEITRWDQLIPSARSEKIIIYTRSDACGAAEMWAEYIGSNQESLIGIGVLADPGITDAVINDELGIGYSNIIYTYDTRSRIPYKGLMVVPIDLNSNGKLDVDENIFGSLDEIMKAIADGRYPSPPSRNLYLVSKGKPVKKSTRDFLNWIMTDGQKFVNEAGFVQLKAETINSQLQKISN